MVNAILETLDKKNANGKINSLQISYLFLSEIEWFRFRDKQEPWNWLLHVSMLQQQTFMPNINQGYGKWISLLLMQLVNQVR